MQIGELVIATPYYVLMDEKAPFGPSVVGIPDIEFSVIFGFSDKAPYDNFCRASSVALTPYPLVKGYLRNQLGAPGHDDDHKRSVKLVVLDAPGPCEPSIHAATMQAVLEAQEKGTAQVAPTHHLVFDPEAKVYRLEKRSSNEVIDDDRTS